MIGGFLFGIEVQSSGKSEDLINDFHCKAKFYSMEDLDFLAGQLAILDRERDLKIVGNTESIISHLMGKKVFFSKDVDEVRYILDSEDEELASINQK